MSVIRCRGATATSGDLDQQECSDGLYRQSGAILNSRSFVLSVPADHAFAEIPLGASEGHQDMPSLVTCRMCSMSGSGCQSGRFSMAGSDAEDSARLFLRRRRQGSHGTLFRPSRGYGTVRPGSERRGFSLYVSVRLLFLGTYLQLFDRVIVATTLSRTDAAQLDSGSEASVDPTIGHGCQLHVY